MAERDRSAIITASMGRWAAKDNRISFESPGCNFTAWVNPRQVSPDRRAARGALKIIMGAGSRAAAGVNAMQREQKFRVVGIQKGGDRIAITIPTSRETAERIADLIRANSAFAELIVEADAGANDSV